MRILVVAQQFFPDSVGGSSRVAFEQARHLALRGHELSIVIPQLTPHAKEHECLYGMDVYRYGGGIRHFLGQSFADVKYAPSLLRAVIGQHNPEVIIGHQPTIVHACLGVSTLPLVYIFHASVPKEVGFQGLTGVGAWKKLFTPAFVFWLSLLERETVTAADRIATLSEYSGILLSSLYNTMVTKKMRHIATGIDSNEYAPPTSREAVRAQLGIPEDCMMFLTVRRLVPRMGLLALIDACSPLCKENEKMRVYIAGEGPQFTLLKNRISEQGVQNQIILTGRIRQGDLPLWYQAANCFVMSSRAYEGLGIATLEALSTGIPVLGTPVGATPEILRNVDKRLIFDDFTSEAMRRGMSWFLHEGMYDETIGKKGRDFVKTEHSWEHATDVLEELLHDAINVATQKLERVSIYR